MKSKIKIKMLIVKLNGTIRFTTILIMVNITSYMQVGVQIPNFSFKVKFNSNSRVQSLIFNLRRIESFALYVFIALKINGFHYFFFRMQFCTKFIK